MPCHKKEHGPQAQDGKDVGCEDNQWVPGNRKDGGNAVERKHHIGCFDHYEYSQERRGNAGGLPRSEEPCALIILVHRNEFADQVE